MTELLGEVGGACVSLILIVVSYGLALALIWAVGHAVIKVIERLWPETN